MVEINPERLLGDLYRLREFGTYKTGVHRPTLSDDHVASLHWFAGRCEAAGLKPTIDGIANVLAETPNPGPRILAGSHLESQNQAGWLDGPLGCIYALEAARAISEDPDTADIALDVVAFCDEEGHFGSLPGSHSMIGEFDDAAIDASRNRTTGEPFRDALARAGFDGRARIRLDPSKYVGFLEAHIEQGRRLETDNLHVGVVTSIVGIWEYRITFAGEQNHAGTTRMAERRDAGLAARRLCHAIDTTFPDVVGERSVWTVGRMTLEPGAPSIVPGRAEVIFQMRDADIDTLNRMEAHLKALVAEADRAGPCSAELFTRRATIPVATDTMMRDAINRAAERRVPGKHIEMPSAAGHDAQVIAKIMPAAMMFVPSIGGISHHWTENTSDEDLVAGMRVYADAVVEIARAARQAAS